MSPGLSRDELKTLIRTVPDFPSEGIQFRDITTLLAHGEGLLACVQHMCEIARELRVDAVAGIEARGFIFGTAVALELGLGFIPLRKAGKLPVETIGEDYALEYGSARLELDPSVVNDGAHVLVVDDLLATGGTALAAAKLFRRAGAHVNHALFVVDLPELPGGKTLSDAGITPHALVEFAGH